MNIKCFVCYTCIYKLSGHTFVIQYLTVCHVLLLKTVFCLTRFHFQFQISIHGTCHTFFSFFNKARKRNVWVAGDLHLPKVHPPLTASISHSTSKVFIEGCNGSNLSQSVSVSTRDSIMHRYFFITNRTLVQKVNILPGFSDHEIVQIQVNNSARRICSEMDYRVC